MHTEVHQLYTLPSIANINVFFSPFLSFPPFSDILPFHPTPPPQPPSPSPPPQLAWWIFLLFWFSSVCQEALGQVNIIYQEPLAYLALAVEDRLHPLSSFRGGAAPVAKRRGGQCALHAEDDGPVPLRRKWTSLAGTPPASPQLGF